MAVKKRKILQHPVNPVCHLLKWCHFQQDTEGRNVELRYFRDVERREVDAAMELARRSGVDTASTQCVPCGKSKVLLVERFDIDPTTLRRNHVISMLVWQNENLTQTIVNARHMILREFAGRTDEPCFINGPDLITNSNNLTP